MSGTNDSFNSNTCVVCYKNVEIYSIGMCEHPVCYECSTRMRVLCRQNECPICRQDLPKVVFTREIKPFRYLCRGNLLDNQYAIYFGSSDIQDKFNDLLANTCSICKEKQVFGSFHSLKDHMRQRHELHYCDLCVENLKIFSQERRCYTRASLAQHRRKGDLDDKSHKGHPLCEFCDQRYMDNDELYRHLRRDHLYCHFCDADGLHQYYSSYDYLRDHFRQEHYLCEEGVCAEEKFTSVFRTDIDLKAHKASVHGKQLSKAAAKQARTLELEFTLAPRGENRMNRRGMLSASTSRNTREHYNNGRDYHHHQQQQQQQQQGAAASGASTSFESFFVRQPSVDVQSTDEFPTLGNAAPVVPTLTQTKGRGNVTIRSTVRNQPLAVTDENFPALGPDSAGPSISKTVNFSVSSGSNAAGSSMPQCQKASTSSNVSIQVNHEANGTVTTRVSGPNIRIRPAQLSIDSDFPALGNSEPSTSTANSTQWKEVLQWTCSKSAPTNAAKSKKVAPPPLASSPPPIRSGEDFPSLSKSSKSKKQSVITVVPTWGQNSSSHASASNNNNNNNNTNNNNNAKTTTDLTKGKTKKKKVKQQTSNGNSSSGNESNSSRSNANTSVVKKDVEHSSARAGESRVSKENSQAAHGTSNENAPKSSRETSQTEHASKKDKKKNKSNADNGSSGVSLVHTEASSDGNASANGMQKKRSELKIDSLNTTNNNIHKMEDFPALGSSSSRQLANFANPPPGFGSPVPPPPPGFSVKYNSLDRLHGSNGLTFTSSSGESYSILPPDDTGHVYVPPPDFQKRNTCLVARLNEVLLHQDKIDKFRYVSGLFRGGTCDAEEYYTHCREVMGSDAFENVFPELLVLLPDIAKQQELFKVHKRELGGKAKGLDVCATCSQVVKNGGDLRTHMSSHTLENHFPALGKNSTPPLKNTWVRK
ncbi:E3 ubiquitin-protein ligase ZNF598 [Harpegnathos saltator]|uniref:RING-type E3 ubiquitin transferase n=1 Tax=Harpegnathos saltator TaxID=610380 RepID=E2BQ19_HARSA|nr:E3 ubiquitin-protein ligase ZNF598 [Harpegnathos saltator]XP_011143011.1 E3 ubiquitin-protein ligase ZNF598 [Harpegnathos saltator]XP_011143012.1 E3 ubiquitin-protein ligase ZNF598 [Harpegnathos saltator]XP_011143013.1 E3 ubiquitin-protein ligase ZNF598 [Harpegnathos saltator]XP_019697944.1 E3 ubiquitin-protein ligase ZNF598 [Harpegnathos saltator]EFN82207.1 Zinc finger protein 598 [Harpegnathos saltator]